VFISVLDTGPYVLAAQLPFIPYCEKDLPLGSVRQMTDRLSKLQGQAALEFSISAVASGLESYLPKTLLENRVDALVLDQVDCGLGLVPMYLGMPYVHVSNALHLDYSGNTPFCIYDWQHETTPEALGRNLAGVRGFMRVYEPAISIAHDYARQVGLEIDWTRPFATMSRLAWLTQTPERIRFLRVPIGPRNSTILAYFTMAWAGLNRIFLGIV
jgi:zeaxanthin glucosyltransferase